MQEKGVNTKSMKHERDEEYAERMDDLQKEQDEKMKIVREDYLTRLREAKNPAEKDKILEEMARRLKAVEASLAEEKKKQESQLSKMLKARQKKQLKTKEKEMDKEVD